MARTQARMFLALALLGIFFLDASVKGVLRGEQQEEEEEERSCQGAFDLYFVLDKWVSDIIYGFVSFSSLRIAMQPPSCLETRSASVGFSLHVSFVLTAREKSNLQVWTENQNQNPVFIKCRFVTHN